MDKGMNKYEPVSNAAESATGNQTGTPDLKSLL